MGDRSNIIIINSRDEVSEKQDLVSGVALYSHGGGVSAQINALDAISNYGFHRIDDPGYFNRIAIRAFTRGDDKECGSGVLPVSLLVERARNDLFKESAQLWPFIPDNEYPIICLNLVDKSIKLYDDSLARLRCLFTGELSEDGITAVKNRLS